MGQQPSIPITNQQSSLHILSLHEELLAMIASFLDSESQLTLAHTCKIVHTYHKGKFKKEIVAFLCNPQINADYKYECCKALEHWLGNCEGPH
jgi:hypothetical protein